MERGRSLIWLGKDSIHARQLNQLDFFLFFFSSPQKYDFATRAAEFHFDFVAINFPRCFKRADSFNKRSSLRSDETKDTYYDKERKKTRRIRTYGKCTYNSCIGVHPVTCTSHEEEENLDIFYNIIHKQIWAKPTIRDILIHGTLDTQFANRRTYLNAVYTCDLILNNAMILNSVSCSWSREVIICIYVHMYIWYIT